MPTATVIPVLAYPDVTAAVDWLEKAFGFEARLLIGPGHRAQLRVGETGAVVVASHSGPQGPAASASSVLVRVADVSTHAARARAAGARIIAEPTEMPYGEKQYSVIDLAGHSWTFSETLSDVAPETWGGVTT